MGNWRLCAGIILAAGLITALVMGLPSGPSSVLRNVGHILIADEPAAMADIIIVSPDAGGAGALEAADMVHGNVATRVAVFIDPPSGEEQEYLRRGLPYENRSAQQIRQLKALGVNQILQIARTDAGTEGVGQVLPAWCREHQVKSLIFVTTRDHSRRMQRVLARNMRGERTIVAVRGSRHSSFNPDGWWKTTRGIRTLIVELEKLVRDIVLHPI